MYPDILYLCSKVGAIIVAVWNQLKMELRTWEQKNVDEEEKKIKAEKANRHRNENVRGGRYW